MWNCVSCQFLGGETYLEMKALSPMRWVAKSLWSDTQYVRRMLSIKHDQEEGKNFWHWVVFKRVNDQLFVLDSASYLPSNIRQDFDAMQPKWFIEVKKCITIQSSRCPQAAGIMSSNYARRAVPIIS
ncbi:hypothetical protein SAMN05216317_10783 [Nitrosomonas eutropha]|nr:hypothetical protein SAMN05216317_10783 [Nitrosomonas eutropha]